MYGGNRLKIKFNQRTEKRIGATVFPGFGGVLPRLPGGRKSDSCTCVEQIVEQSTLSFNLVWNTHGQT